MPKTKSAKKALRQNLRRRARNLAQKNELKIAVKRYGGLITSTSKDEAKKYLAHVYKAIDKAVKTGSLKKNTANRLKSRLSKKLK